MDSSTRSTSTCAFSSSLRHTLVGLALPLSVSACDKQLPVEAEITQVTRDSAIFLVTTEPGANVSVDGKHTTVADEAGKATIEVPMADLADREPDQQPGSSISDSIESWVSVSKPAFLREGSGGVRVGLNWRPSLLMQAKEDAPLVLIPVSGKFFSLALGETFHDTGSAVAMMTTPNAEVSLWETSFTTNDSGFGVWEPNLDELMPAYTFDGGNEVEVEVDGEVLAKLRLHLRDDALRKVYHRVRRAIEERTPWPYTSESVVAKWKQDQAEAAAQAEQGDGTEEEQPTRAPVLIVREAEPSKDGELLALSRLGVLHANDAPLAAIEYVAIEKETGRRESNETCYGQSFDNMSAGSAKLIPVDTELTIFALPDYDAVATLAIEGGDGGCPDAFTDGEKLLDYANETTVMQAVWDKLPAQ